VPCLKRSRSCGPRNGLWRTQLGAFLVASALAVAMLAPANGDARARVAGPPSLPFLALAERGLASAQSRWHDAHLHWYDERLADHDRYPLATIWGSVPLFESLDAVALAAPSAAHRTAVNAFARGAERYFDKKLSGFAPYPGDRGNVETWFDDNGWWGLAFVDAHSATGQARWLGDAQRAFAFIAARGWRSAGGGIWWNTDHQYLAGEALASATLLGAELYRLTGRASYLQQVHKFLSWAETSFIGERGLYERTDSDPTPTPYIEGTMVEAHQLLCEGGEASACARARELANACWARFASRLTMGPQFDTIYLHWMLVYASQAGDARWPALAQQMANQAQTQALVSSTGLYLRAWDGSAISEHEARPGMLQTQAATSELFAWLAATSARNVGL
jgi:hypothetical protein